MTGNRQPVRERRRRDVVTRLVHRLEAGAAGGIAAAVAIAALFFMEGAVDLHPLSAATSLATGLLGGGSGGSGAASQVGSYVIVPLEMAAYSVVHLLAWVAIGVTAAFVVKASAFWTSLAGAVAYTCIAGTGLLYLVRWFADAPVALDVLGFPRVLLANALAGAVIGTALYLGEQSDRRGMTM